MVNENFDFKPAEIIKVYVKMCLYVAIIGYVFYFLGFNYADGRLNSIFKEPAHYVIVVIPAFYYYFKEKKYLNFLSKNWPQAKYSSVIYASGSLTESGKRGYKGHVNKSKYTVVEGGTAYAIQMAINNNKKVYFYNQDNDTWNTWNNNKKIWEEIENVLTSSQWVVDLSIHEFEASWINPESGEE